VPVVQDASRALALCLTLALLGGCSSSSGDKPPPPSSGVERIGTPVRLADCTDWERATLRQRFGTVREIRGIAGGPTGTVKDQYGNTLPDEKAVKLFDRACKQTYARGFKLYKLYNRAAAFSAPRRPETP
jgi:hypothetical protein